VQIQFKQVSQQLLRLNSKNTHFLIYNKHITEYIRAVYKAHDPIVLLRGLECIKGSIVVPGSNTVQESALKSLGQCVRDKRTYSVMMSAHHIMVQSQR